MFEPFLELSLIYTTIIIMFSSPTVGFVV
jgi:hypothetical protein